MVVSSARAFFFRIPRPSQFINPYSFLYIPERFQGYHCYHGLSNNSKECASKGILYFKGWNNKMKAVNPVWRPISTQSTSNEAEGVQVSHGSVAQNSFEVADAEKVSTASKEKIVVSVEVGASVMRFIGYKDKSLRQSIEEEMGVKLIFPLSKKEDSIVIEGDSMDAITKASEKIQAIIDKAVNSSALTFSHLISLPLAIHNELVDKLNRFQSTVLAYSDSKDADGTMDVDSSDEASEDEEKSVKPVNTPDVAANLKVDDIHNVKRDTKDIPLVSYAPKTSGLGIDKSIFIKPKRFHLTVVMLKLWNKGRVNAAKEVLQSISSELIEVLENRPLFIRLKGLDCLRGSRTKAQVLYAPVEEIGNEGRLHRACQLIIDAYVKAGLVLERDAKQKLKLHATVMNTTQRKGVNRRKHKRGKDSFDATPIFEQFGSEAWGDYLIREAHLSQRFLYDDNGYYHCCAAIPFPEIAEVPATSATPAESVEESIAESV
ncbi:uncharacterized protein LOC110729834 isoform X4 [Chenopodium quinoa]|uniref:uncharacterized protein LOC110729834 isoform X4 n=1 Tax=Chenopodium quinoa TaxID=63459 RepID=UPI000B77BB7F|nr:uncharacterized protein LOC110729834 isoform X4 [Chenopodium quinoa]